MWLYIAFVVLAVLTLYNAGTLPTVNILLSIILLRKESIQRISLVIVCAFIVELVVYLSAFNLGILQDGTKIYAKGMTRDLGFRNSNTPGLYFVMLTLCTAMFFRLTCKMKFPLLLFFLPTWGIYALTLGRTSFYSVCLFFSSCITFLFDGNIVLNGSSRRFCRSFCFRWCFF